MNGSVTPDYARTLFAAERRQRIYELVLSRGSASVAEMAQELQVTVATVRNDLNLLEKEGKLMRSHGGAVVRETALQCPAYSQTRDAHRQEKSWIGSHAINFLPASGAIYIGAGSTIYEFASRIPENRRINVVTYSLDVAGLLAAKLPSSVYILGGRVNPEFNGSDYSWSEEIFSKLHWDTSFIGAEAVDLTHGITSTYQQWASHESKLIEHSKRTVILVDSSKFGRVSHVEVCPLSMIDVLITDCNVSQETVDAMVEQGVDVVVAGPPRNGGNGHSCGGNGDRH